MVEPRWVGGQRKSGLFARRASATGPLASELGGDVPCVRCRYNLRGLSIRGVCSECGTPVRVTLLALVDPLADELRPIRWPRLTAAGLLMWAIAALGAAIAAWAVGLSGSAEWAPLGRAMASVWPLPAILAAMSGIGAVALVAPHPGISRRNRALATAAVGAYIPLAWVLWRLHGEVVQPVVVSDPMRATLWIGAEVLMAGIILGLRPNARLLVARSLLMRSGRVDRQTLWALVAVLGVGVLGDALALLAPRVGVASSEVVAQAGRVVSLVASILFTAGLVGVVWDCVRLRPVIVDAPLSLSGLLTKDRPGANPPGSGSGEGKP